MMSVLLPAAFVFAQTATSTASTSSLSSLINQLQEQIRSLQTQVAELKSQLETVKTELKFTKALQRGASGEEVKALQEFLKKFPDIYPEGLVTGYYGALTEQAVKRLQEKQGLEPVGTLGPRTRAKLNELISEGAGSSGLIPPGLLSAPGLQMAPGTTAQGTTTSSPAVPATPAVPIGQTGTTTVPAIPATPATSTSSALATTTPTQACGKTLNVPSDKYSNIQSALDASCIGDVIRIASGAYFGKFNLTSKHSGITITGAGLSETVIQGSGSWVFYINGLKNAAIKNLTIVRGGGRNIDGGGIWIANSENVILEGCRISESTANQGGALAIQESSVTITRCLFDHNTAYNSAGGIIIRDNSRVTITNATIAYNTALGCHGGGLFVGNSTVSVKNSILWGNAASQPPGSGCGWGPAIYGDPTVSYSDIQFGFKGTGNIDSNPYFISAPGGDFHLSSPSSPAYNSGDPSTLDPDGTRADMGVFPYGVIALAPVAVPTPTPTVISAQTSTQTSTSTTATPTTSTTTTTTTTTATTATGATTSTVTTTTAATATTTTTQPITTTTATTTVSTGTATTTATATTTTSVGTTATTATSTAATSTNYPDFVITSFTMAPSQPSVGQSVQFTAVVKNQGNASAGATTLVFNNTAAATMSSIGLNFFTADISALSADQSVSIVSPSVTISISGRYIFYATVNPDGVIMEGAGAGNNVAGSIVLDAINAVVPTTTTLPAPTYIRADWSYGWWDIRDNTMGQRLIVQYPTDAGSKTTKFRLYRKWPGDSAFSVATEFAGIDSTLCGSNPDVVAGEWILDNTSCGNWVISRVKSGVTSAYTMTGGSFSASSYTAGDHSYYIVAVDSTGKEGLPSPTATLTFLDPLTIISPTAAQSPTSLTPTFQWTTGSNWSSLLPQIVMFDSPSATNPFWISGDVFGNSKIYNGPALDPAKRYRFSMYGISANPAQYMSRLGLPAAVADFWVTAATSTSAAPSASLASILESIAKTLQALRQLVNQMR